MKPLAGGTRNPTDPIPEKARRDWARSYISRRVSVNGWVDGTAATRICPHEWHQVAGKGLVFRLTGAVRSDGVVVSPPAFGEHPRLEERVAKSGWGVGFEATNDLHRCRFAKSAPHRALTAGSWRSGSR